MAKTLIDIDDELLEQVRAFLGTTTKKETVNSALREVLATRDRREAVLSLSEWAAHHEPLEPGDRRRAWRQ